MKTLFKLAVGAAIAGALVNMALRQMRQQRGARGVSDDARELFGDEPPRGTAGFTLAELAQDHNTAGVDPLGDGDGDRLRSAGEGRAGKKILNA